MNRFDRQRIITKSLFPFYTNAFSDYIDLLYKKHKNDLNINELIVTESWKRFSRWLRPLIPLEKGSDGDPLASSFKTLLTPDDIAHLLKQINDARDYDDNLNDLEDDDIIARSDELLKQKKQRRNQERLNRGAKSDLYAFFNTPDAQADLSTWMLLPMWSAEEAAALSFGKEPTVVNSNSIREFKRIHGSPFQDSFFKRLSLVERAVAAKGLADPIRPKAFIKWLQQRRIASPLIGPDQTVQQPDPDLSAACTARLNKCYQIILGLAIRHYAFDPKFEATEAQAESRTKKAQAEARGKIAKDLADVSAGVDPKTLRKILEAASIWARGKDAALVETKSLKKLRAGNFGNSQS